MTQSSLQVCLPGDRLLHVLYHPLLCLEELSVTHLHAMYLRLHGLDLTLTYVRVNGSPRLPSQLCLLLPEHDLSSAETQKFIKLYAQLGRVLVVANCD